MTSPEERQKQNDKNVTKKPTVSSISVSYSILISSIITYTRTTVIIDNIDKQGALAPSVFVNQFICVIRLRLRFFVQKLAISSPSIYHKA